MDGENEVAGFCNMCHAADSPFIKDVAEEDREAVLRMVNRVKLGAVIFVDENTTLEQIREGSEATLRQLKSALERNKVIEISPAAGSKFDPAHHQAISMVPSEQEANTVVTVLQKGYLIAERVLRPALVTVSAPK